MEIKKACLLITEILTTIAIFNNVCTETESVKVCIYRDHRTIEGLGLEGIFKVI